MLRDFLPPEGAVVVTGAGVTDARVAGRFDTPLDESFDALHALAVVYVFQTRPERYAALDVQSAMGRKTALAYRAEGVTLGEDEVRAVQALASALNSKRQAWVKLLGAANTDEERCRHWPAR